MKWFALLVLLVRERSIRTLAERAAAESAELAERRRLAFDDLQRYHVKRMAHAQDQIDALRRELKLERASRMAALRLLAEQRREDISHG